MYQILLLSGAIFTVICYSARKIDGFIYKVLLLIMTVMLCLRYGQGTDYFAYKYIYEKVPNTFDINFILSNDFHGEIGYYFIQELFRIVNAPFIVFCGSLSFVSMVLIHKGIKELSKYKTLSLFLLMPTYYFTYLYSGIREGFVLAITIGIIIPAYIKGNTKKYIIALVVSTLFHLSAIVLFIPLILRAKGKRITDYSAWLIVFSVAFAVVVSVLLQFLHFQSRYVAFSPSYLAIIIRCVFFFLISKAYTKKCLLGENEMIDDKLVDFYFIGFIVYLCLCPMALISARVTAYFKIAEILLFPRLVSRTIKKKTASVTSRRIVVHLFVIIVIVISLVEGFKNLGSYADQGHYNENIGFYNYPYISIFGIDKLYEYRSVSYYDTLVND